MEEWTNVLQTFFEPMPGDEHKINAIDWAFIPPSSDLITRIPRLSVYKRSRIGDPPLLLTGTVNAQPLERKRKPSAREKRLHLAKARQKPNTLPASFLFHYCSWSARFCNCTSSGCLRLTVLKDRSGAGFDAGTEDAGSSSLTVLVQPMGYTHKNTTAHHSCNRSRV